MTTTDPNPPNVSVDTTGVRGATGPLPVGTQFAALDADTTVYGGGAGGDLTNTKVDGGVADTSATNSPNDPSDYSATGTGLTGTLDTVQGGGGIRVDKNQPYRAPSGIVAASDYDTTRTDSPTSGTVLVTNKTHVLATGVTTIVTDGLYAFSVGEIAVLVDVDDDLDGTQQIATAPTPGTFTFITHKPAGNIVSTAVVGGMVSVTSMAYMTGTLDSYSVGAVPAVGTGVLARPTGVTAAANDHGGIDLAWTPAAQSGSKVVKRWMVESSRGYSQSVPANVTTFDTYSAWMLEASVPITFTVRAVNDFGTSAPSVATAPVTPKNINFTGYVPGTFYPDAQQNPVETPSGDVDFFFTATQSRTSVVFDWTLPPTDHAYSGGTIKVYNAAGSQVGSTHTLAGTDETLTVTGLTYGASYTAVVEFTNSVGTYTSEPEHFTMDAVYVPGAPTGVNATDAGSHTANVVYTAPADTGGTAITSYLVEWSADSFATVAGFASDAASPYVAATGAGPFKFRVTANNALGAGAHSTVTGVVTIA